LVNRPSNRGLLVLTVAAAACTATVGCMRPSLTLDDGRGPGGTTGGSGGGSGGAAGRPAPTRDVDVLFMIDNSALMTTPQMALINSFPRFIDVLENLPDGRPNLHIAVVSSDLGAAVGIMSCNGSGDAGVFRFSPRAPCTDTTLGAGTTFIVNNNGIANYDGDLRTVFACIANLGATGCGFESPLASIARALGADGPPPPENAGFLRPDALLAIVILSNEDDCSARLGPSSPLFSTTPNNLAGPVGPVGSFRCSEFGHICDEGTPARLAPNGLATDRVTYTNCRSNEDSPHLKSVGSLVAAIRSLKAFPDEQIVVASIVGVPKSDPYAPIPYEVSWSPAPVADTGPWPTAVPGCAAGVLFGDPPVRLAEFTRHFGANGLLHSICDDDYGPSFGAIAGRIADHLAN
jgi:hypothetical protein